MNPLIETLQVLQDIDRTATPDQSAFTRKSALRAQVPAPVLAHYDRLAALGRKGVAEVRNGVCGACHLRLPAALSAPRVDHSDLQLCENCGAYLAFRPETIVPAAPLVRVPRKRRYRAVAVTAGALV